MGDEEIFYRAGLSCGPRRFEIGWVEKQKKIVACGGQQAAKSTEHPQVVDYIPS
jgi:hypothetical protein